KCRDRALREDAKFATQADKSTHLRRRRARTAAQLTAQPNRGADHLLDDYRRKCCAPMSADHIAAEGARSRAPHEPGSFVSGPAVSVVSIGAEDHHDHPA